jgi:hypothetical protein
MTTRFAHRTLATFTVLVAALLTVIGVEAKATTETTIITIPFTTQQEFCGEIIAIDGEIHGVIHVTENANGGFHTSSLFHPRGLTGIGLISGARYHAVGETRFSFNSNGATSDTFVNNFKLIGEGRAPNLLIHETIRVTINANGDVTAEVENVSIECRG